MLQNERELLRWNHCAQQKDRALVAIGRIEVNRSNANQALEQLDRFEREVVGSRLFGQAMLARAKILQASGWSAHARDSLEKLLASECAMGKEKAEALYLLGEMHMGESRP